MITMRRLWVVTRYLWRRCICGEGRITPDMAWRLAKILYPQGKEENMIYPCLECRNPHPSSELCGKCGRCSECCDCCHQPSSYFELAAQIGRDRAQLSEVEREAMLMAKYEADRQRGAEGVQPDE